MPMYEYKCKACNHLYERYESYSASGRNGHAVCPRCGKDQGEKLFSTFAASCGSGGGSVSGGCGSGGFS